MIQKKIIKVTLYLILLLWLTGCKKYLNEKPDKKLAIINSAEDMQALLDNFTVMNNRDVGADEVSADDYYLSDADYGTLTENDRRMYSWQKDHLFLERSNNWFYTYSVIYPANTVLDKISDLYGQLNSSLLKNIKGQALFYRARAFLHAAFIWTLAYDAGTANTDLGLPLRVNSDFNIVSVRENLQNTYSRIITDLEKAIPLLPVIAIHKMRPSKPAAYALLARTYLAMRIYDKAGLYADSCLQLSRSLMDFNDRNLINPAARYPIPQFNPEVLTCSRMALPRPINAVWARINRELYNSYADNDLRKYIFFTEINDSTHSFKGSYDQSSALFTSVATDEVYLMRAESSARAGLIDSAMSDLNTLLAKRWKIGTYISFTAANKNDALTIILKERRKELLMRGLRWMDIKRLNKEGANISIERTINGEHYTLPANDLRFALPIPEDVIALSGASLVQNPR